MRCSIRSSRMLQGCLLSAAMAGAAAMAQPNFAGPPPPSLTGFSPAQGAQGSVVTITFTGNNFGGKGLALQFLPAPGLTVQKLQALSASQILAQVQIDASAQLGAHQVMLAVSDRRLPTQLPFTVTGSSCGLPGQPACSPRQEGPALKSFSPLASRQGTSVTVVFTGSRFASPAEVEFSPNAGITVQSTKVVNAGEIEAQLVIDANAPLGARKVLLVLGRGKVRLSSEMPFTVAPEAVMEILRLVPNQIPAGSQNIDLTLEGKNFVPGTIVSFAVGETATDIFVVGAARYVDSTEMHVTVNVLPTALPGGRDIHLETPNQRSVTGKGMLNVQTP